MPSGRYPVLCYCLLVLLFIILAVFHDTANMLWWNKNIYTSSQSCRNATGTHMPHGITQCYLPPGRVSFPPLCQPKLVLDLATTEGCKAELTSWPSWLVTYRDGIPVRSRSPNTNRVRRGFVYATNAANHYTPCRHVLSNYFVKCFISCFANNSA